MTYENLAVWQRSFGLAIKVYKLFRINNDYGFKDQICRSAISVPSNIAEGWERYSNNEKFRFLSIAKGSCGELKTQLMLAKEIGYLAKGDTDITIGEAEEISKMLGGLMNKLKN
jgi:four helix bundle protein